MRLSLVGCFCVLLLLVSCGPSGPSEYAFLSPSKKNMAEVYLAPNAPDGLIRVKSLVTMKVVAEIQLRIPEIAYGRPWAGWSKNEKHVSVLICNADSPPLIHRLSLSSASEKSMVQEQASIVEADSNLILSLKKLQSSNSWQRVREIDDVLDFYCTGFAGESMNQYLDSKRQRFTIP